MRVPTLLSGIKIAAKNAGLTGRPRVQTKWVWGPHERRRWTVFGVKYAIFLVLPWITVGGAPALLFDIPNRRYHAFGAVFWPQDFYLLGMFLAIAALLLFITTSLVSRVWCGYACPQTLLTSLFMLIDRAIEGDRPVRLAMDAGPLTPVQRLRRVLKHAAWVAVAGYLGFTFISYFVGAPELARRMASFQLGGPALAGWLFITGATYLFAGHLRDWICTTTCPYGRFQGAMGDVDSLIVTYDAQRGEPRAKSKEAIARSGCVDCGQCVSACPMGIDIRNGYQYECITCSRCIDACNDTMHKVGAAPDLIRFVSLQEVEAHKADPAVPLPTVSEHRWWRPRLVWYASVLVLLVGTWITLIVQRPMLGIEVTRDRTHMLTLADGRISNLYALKLVNKDTRPRAVRLSLVGLDGELLLGENPLTLAPGELRSLNASVVLARGVRHDGAPKPFVFRLEETGGANEKASEAHEAREAKATFVGTAAASAFPRRPS